MIETIPIEVETDDFKIKGKMSGVIDGIEENTNFKINRFENGGWSGCGTAKEFSNMFRIASPNVEFRGEVSVSLKTEKSAIVLDGWEVGFVQNIHSLKRKAHYNNNVNLSLRQNPINLPIRDGDKGNAIWYDTGIDEKKLLVPDRLIAVKVSDAPNQDFPLKYNGRPGQNIQDYALQEAKSTYNLNRMSGKDEFKTWLIAANEKNKSLIILGGISWSVDWNATYQTFLKRCTKIGNFNQFETVHPQQNYYPNLNLAANLPFNPHYACGFDNFQVKMGEAWSSCGGQGNVKTKNPSTEKWFYN